MHIFQGDLSNKNKKLILHKNKRIGFLVSLIISLLIMIPVIFLTFYKDWIFSLIIIPLLMLIIFSVIPYKNEASLLIPIKLIIYDGLIVCEGKNFTSTKKVSQIAKIIDFGDCYHFIFQFPYKDVRFLCQKDLLIQGKLTDFEELFKDKIIKKDF